jgi:hypothetical protein
MSHLVKIRCVILSLLCVYRQINRFCWALSRDANVPETVMSKAKLLKLKLSSLKVL